MIGFLAILFIIIGLIALTWGRAAQTASGLPSGAVIYSDRSEERRVGKECRL